MRNALKFTFETKDQQKSKGIQQNFFCQIQHNKREQFKDTRQSLNIKIDDQMPKKILRDMSQSSSNGHSYHASQKLPGERQGKKGLMNMNSERRQPSCHSSLVKLQQEMFNMRETDTNHN